MSASRLRLETMRELYQAQRERREGVRNSVATPVAALAFSIFDLSTLAANFRIEMLDEPVGIAVAAVAVVVVFCLLVAAALIIRVERNFIYLDPPDLEELLRMEKALKDQGADDEKASEQLHDCSPALMTSSIANTSPRTNGPRATGREACG